MSDSVIEIDNLWKKYCLGAFGTGTLRHDFNRWWHRVRGKPDPYTKVGQVQKSEVRSRSLEPTFDLCPLTSEVPLGDDEIWALRGVSIEVKQGEILGIIGRNGAGKSTLLKILSRVTAPTSGEVRVKGRIASLLEVGTGFHPELTGRENIFLNGAILGMTKAEIWSKLDEIVAFAEIEKFLDTPVKRYSSGMYVRLAFAVAAHLEPEILLVDEVLAVGDAAFQKKCLGKMSDVAKQGRTVLFVSHNMAVVRKLCNGAILLDQGRKVLSGDTGVVLQKYVENGARTELIYKIPAPKEENPPGWAKTLTVEDSTGKPTFAIPVGQPWQVRVRFDIARTTESFIIALGLRTTEDFVLRTSWSEARDLEAGAYEAVFREESIFLGSGHYPIVIGLSTHERPFHYVENAGVLDIAGFAEGINLVRVSNVGVLLNPLRTEIRKV